MNQVGRLPLRPLTWVASIIFVFTALVLLLVLVVGPLGARNQAGITERQAARSVVFLGGEFDFQVNINGAALPICSAGTQMPGSAVVLVLDRSGSMQDGAGSPLDAARRAAQDFVDNLSVDTGDDQIAVVQFDSNAQVVSPLGGNSSASKQAISGIRGGGGTAIHAGLASARQALIQVPAGKNPVIVLLSDGESNPDAALAEADAAKAVGIRIITIALGQANQTLLQEIASSMDDFYSAPDPSALQAVYAEIAAQVGPLVATNVRVVEFYNNAHFSRADDDGMNSGRVERRFAVMTAAGRTVGYRLEANKMGGHSTSSSPGTLQYEDCNAQPVLQTLPEGPKVLVLLPLIYFLLPLLLSLLWLLLRVAYWYWKKYIWEPDLAPRIRQEFPSRRQVPEPLKWNGPATPWEPEPALIIGLGGTGRWVLTHLKHNLLDAGAGTLRPQVHLLALDTAAQEFTQGTQKNVEFAGTRLTTDEMLVVTEENLSDLIREMAQQPKKHPDLREWFPAADYDARLGFAQRDLARGTNGRRPMGRIALFRNLRNGPENSTLWQSLMGGIKAVMEGVQQRDAGYQRLRVMIIGSLAGGFGSGSLIDVAYLARRACESQGLQATDAEVSLFLVGNAPFEAQAGDDQPLLRVNTRAALREVERFLLSRNRPFPMLYSQNDTADQIGGQARNILDDCWFLDGERGQESLASSTISPEMGIFPMLADALMVLLDTQAQSAGASLGALRNTVAGRTQTLQAELGQGVFSSFGSYTYRLPALALANILKVQFAQQLLRWLLAGDPEADLTQPLRADANREMAGQTPAVFATNFMAGRSGSGNAPPPLELAYVVHSTSPPSDKHELLIEVGLRSKKEGDHTYRAQEKSDFSEYLGDALWRILNGGTSAPLSVGRVGKLAYAQAVLKELIALLQQTAAISGWQDRDRRLPRWTGNAARILPDVLQDYREVIAIALKELQKQEKILLQTVYGDVASSQTTCVADELAHQESVANESLKALPSVQAVRHYLLADDDVEIQKRRHELMDDWYQKHFLPNLEQALDFLLWEVDPDLNRIALTVQIHPEGCVDAVALSIKRFAAALLTLADHGGRAMWAPDVAVEIMAEVLGPLIQRDSMIEALHQRSQPVLPFVAAGFGQNAAEHRYLWSPRGGERSRWRDVRGQLVTSLAPKRPTSLEDLNSTDLFSTTIITLLDYVPLHAIDRVGRLEDSYLSYYGMRQEAGIGTSSVGAVHPEPSATFAAEQRASTLFERQMLKMPERRAWLLSALFVGALDKISAADPFLQAYAAGMIRIVPTSDGLGQICILDLGEKRLQLTVPENANWRVALEVVGMQNFVLDTDDPRICAQPGWVDRENLLGQALYNIGETHLNQRWAAFDQLHLNRVPTQYERLGLDDLVICARILVRLKLGALSRG